MKRRTLVRSAAAVVACAGLIGSWVAARSHEAAPAAGEAAATHFVFAWPRGQELTYAFAWKAESALAIGAAAEPMRGAIDVRGDLVLRSFGPRGDATTVEITIEHPTAHAFSILGADAMPDDESARKTLVGHAAMADIGTDGVVRSIAFRKNDPEVFKAIVERVIAQATPTLRADGVLAPEGWQSSEMAPAGRASVTYTPAIGAPLELARHRAAYTDLTAIPWSMRHTGEIDLVSDGSVTLDARGWVTITHDDERLVVRHGGSPAPTLTETTSFSATLAHEGTFDPTREPIAADLEARRSGELQETPESESRTLDQRVAGLTREQLLGDLATYGVTGRMPNQNRWLFRASGLLVKHPEIAPELSSLLASRSSTMDGRAMIMDILAAAGTKEAQAAMRDAMATPKAHADSREYAMLVQRFSFLQAPDADSLAFLSKGTRAGDDNARGASTFALGAAIGKLEHAGRAGEAARYHRDLTNVLRDARTADARSIALGALGNAGRAEDAPEIARIAKNDGDENVRAAAVRALRDDATEDARGAIVDAMADPSPAVERAAFSALGPSPSEGDLADLARLVTAGRTLPSTDADLVNVIAASARSSTDARRTLAFVLSRTGDDLDLAARVRGILGHDG